MVGFNVDWIGMDTHMAVASSEGLSYFVGCVNALGSSLFGKLVMDFSTLVITDMSNFVEFFLNK